MDTATRTPTVQGMVDEPGAPQPGDDDLERAVEDAMLWFHGASGTDPGTPDPGCPHDWLNIGFADDDAGLVCTRCERTWNLDEGDQRDAILTIWNSTRRALERNRHVVDRLTSLVEALVGHGRCHWCENWYDPEALVTIGRRRACPEHVGQVLTQNTPPDPDELLDTARWVDDLISDDGREPYRYWLADKAALECPILDDGPADGLELGRQTVTVDQRWARLLEISGPITVDEIAGRVAERLELPRPNSRPGRNLLLGILALSGRHCERAGQSENDTGTGSETLVEILADAVPTSNRDRATVVFDLFRHELPPDGTVSGEMADDLVEALIERAAAELVPDERPGT